MLQKYIIKKMEIEARYWKLTIIIEKNMKRSWQNMELKSKKYKRVTI